MAEIDKILPNVSQNVNLPSASKVALEQQQQMAQQVTNMATDPRVAIEAGKSLANSGAEVGMDGGDLTINQPEQE